jgi:beta-glucanase (GH16 family)
MVSASRPQQSRARWGLIFCVCTPLFACVGNLDPHVGKDGQDPGSEEHEGNAGADAGNAPMMSGEGDGDVTGGSTGDGDSAQPGDGDAPVSSAPTDSQRDGFRLVWSDEFDGTAGTLPDASKWGFDVGGDGWGNDQREFDTERAENASLDGAGHLAITARQEDYQGRQYTSARLKTAGKFEQTYGRFEARMKLPQGQGIWPAFWMLGNNIGDAGWPACGEIDIMESIGREPATVYGTIHGPGYSGAGGISKPYNLPNASFPDDFHVFAVEWDEGSVRWYVDEKLYVQRTPADLPQGTTWVYDHPFFIILNLAIGGLWPGPPDGSTTFPQVLLVDHVRVYQRE